MKSFKAVIFDLDGVIIDSEPRHEQAFHEIWKEMGYASNHGIEFEHYYGKSDRAVWEDFIARHQPEQSIEELIARKQEKFLEIIRAEQPIFAGLPELVEEVSHRYPLAVASGSAHAVIEAALALKDLKRFFPVVVSSQDVAHPKPAPDIFLRTAELLHVAPEDCCVIEDSVFGVTAAKAADMTCIAITNTFKRDKLQQADHVVDTYEEVRRLLMPALDEKA